MAAKYYCADSENGDHIDDPSEDALFDLISELNDSDNTFVVIQPDQDDPAWFASVFHGPYCRFPGGARKSPMRRFSRGQRQARLTPCGNRHPPSC